MISLTIIQIGIILDNNDYWDLVRTKRNFHTDKLIKFSLVCRRHEKFWENKLGWKTDLKKLLDEIYAFTDHSDIPLPLRYTEACNDETSTFDGYMISHADEVSTVLMKKALYKALNEGSNLSDKELKHLERYL